MRLDLEGKVALVGGSTGGIGRAIAVKFAEAGADIVVHGRDAEAGREVVDEIEKAGRRGHFETADIRDAGQVREMVGRVLSRWGKIDVLVANGAGGFPPPQFFSETDPSLYPEYLNTSLFSRLYFVHSVLGSMRARKEGKIVMTTSEAGRFPTPGESMIGAADAGLILATKVLAKEFSRWRINVNTIAITVTDQTPAFERTLRLEGSLGKMFRKAAESVPFWPITADDIAETALFLASKRSDRITGQTISVSGGLTFPG
jgi:Dehydrogenases with different specificities (related to short-chain alcohol dehydrogenases)